MKELEYDYNELRKDLSNFALGAYFGGKIDVAIMYHDRIQRANHEELIQIARECNFPLQDYEIDDYNRKR
jgi:hypothetical protein